VLLVKGQINWGSYDLMVVFGWFVYLEGCF